MLRKWVILEFGQGSFKTGFPVTVRIGTDGIEGSTRIPDGFLPPAPGSLTEITLEKWRNSFEKWLKRPVNRMITPSSAQTKTVDIDIDTDIGISKQTQNLTNDVKDWLNSKDKKWDKIIIENLLIKLNQTDEIRIIVQTDNPNLRRLPWQVWDLFIEHFHKTEFAFSPSQQKVVGVTASPQKSEKVKILVILGEPLEEGQEKKINYQSDINAINKLGANAEFLRQPTRQELINKLWEKPWQIIFYSGHSSSEIDGSKGYLQLRENEIITIDDLKESLRESITKGLQLAIFNSCQGLGLAKQLEDLALPQVIVMREKVPDVVAQMFLQDFLTAFAGGDGQRYLHDALRESRKKLQDKWENKYPGISWLPVICQQYADGKPLIFNDLRQNHGGDGYLLKLLRELIQAERARNFELVIKLGEQILKIDIQHQISRTKTAFAYRQRILSYYNQGKYDEAIQDCDRAILLSPENADLYYQRARVYYQQKDWEKVIENCTQALKLKKEADYYWQRGLVYYEKANYDQAILDAENSIKHLSSTKAEYHYLYGKSLYAKAISIAFPQAVESTILYVRHPRFYTPISPINPQHMEKMNPLFWKAIDALNKAINNKFSKIADYYWVRGLCYLTQGNNNSAIDDFNYAHELSPNQTNYDYNYLMGRSYQAKGEPYWAISYLTLAIGMLNDSSKDYYYYSRSLSYYNRGNSLLQNATQGNPKSDDMLALEDIKKAIQLNPSNLAFFTLKSQIEKRMSGGR